MRCPPKKPWVQHSELYVDFLSVVEVDSDINFALPSVDEVEAVYLFSFCYYFIISTKIPHLEHKNDFIFIEFRPDVKILENLFKKHSFLLSGFL